jgi:TPR repeat protein
MQTWFVKAAMLMAAIFLAYRANAQVPRALDDPLRRGHALLIGNSHYRDPSWARLDDIPSQLLQLEKGLRDHFDTVQVAQDLEAKALLGKINDFIREYGNDSNARLLIYYAGHGYTELQRNENRGYITGIDTPHLDGTQQAYTAARLKAISMAEIRAPLERAPAKSILLLFDSCFAGTVFTNRAGNDPRPLTRDIVTQLMERPARDIITAGSSDQRVPAHSPIPALFLAALNGAADRYKHGVISSSEIHEYLLDRVLQIRDINLTPQAGKLPNPDFAEGTFLFRVLNPTAATPDEGESIRLLHGGADGGDINAQVNLAYLYQEGRGGLAKDDREAARLYKLAADRGNAAGQAGLGFFYELGRGGLPKDDREAARLFKLAADQGSARGQNNLGVFYERGGGGLPTDDREAARLYKLAADQGFAPAQANLGVFYDRGRGGLPKDDREAARLYKLPAGRGDAHGQANLGDFYREGRGGPPRTAARPHAFTSSPQAKETRTLSAT